MPRSSTQPFTWKETNLENVTILNPSFDSPINPTNNRTMTLSNLLSTQPIPNWTFQTESVSMMIGRGATIYNMSDAASNQYLIASYNITEDNVLSQSVNIATPGLYKIIYYINGRLAFQGVTITLYLSNISQIKKISSIPDSAQWTRETSIINVPSAGTYTLNIRIKGGNQQMSSLNRLSMNRFELSTF